MVKIEDLEIIPSYENKWYIGTYSKKDPNIMNETRKEIDPEIIAQICISSLIEIYNNAHKTSFTFSIETSVQPRLKVTIEPEKKCYCKVKYDEKGTATFLNLNGEE